MISKRAPRHKDDHLQFYTSPGEKYTNSLLIRMI